MQTWACHYCSLLRNCRNFFKTNFGKKEEKKLKNHTTKIFRKILVIVRTQDAAITSSFFLPFVKHEYEFGWEEDMIYYITLGELLFFFTFSPFGWELILCKVSLPTPVICSSTVEVLWYGSTVIVVELQTAAYSTVRRESTVSTTVTYMWPSSEASCLKLERTTRSKKERERGNIREGLRSVSIFT